MINWVEKKLKQIFCKHEWRWFRPCPVYLVGNNEKKICDKCQKIRPIPKKIK